MFTANGRAGQKPDSKTKASVSGKEFVCPVCGQRKRLISIEFGEVVTCKCGQPMIEGYED